MGEVVNLRQARKAKARDAAAQTAQENRAKLGQTKAQKSRVSHEHSQAEKALDGHKRDASEGGEDPC